MDLSRVDGAQYVRLTPGAAGEVALYLGVAPAEIDELLLELVAWPAEIQPAPRTTRNGRLIPGDPVLIGANDLGLLFARGDPEDPASPVLVAWASVRALDVVGVPTTPDPRVVCHM